MRAPVCLAFAILVSAACGENDNASQLTVGTAGGTLIGSDGSKVEIPKGALPQETTITISSVENLTAPTGTTVVGTAFQFGPEGASFTTPVTITLGFSANDLPAGTTAADVVVYTAAAGSTAYEALPTTRVAGADQVSVSVKHFSIFVPVVKTPTACPITCKPEIDGICDCTSSCGDHAYKLSCYSLEGCTCTKDGGASTRPDMVVSCSDTAKRYQIFKTGCMFPGDVP